MKKRKNIKYMILALLVFMMLSGFASHPRFNIKASVPAYIEVDG